MAETSDTTSVGKPTNALAGFRGFLGEVKVEMQKCTWPTRQELKEQTTVVIVSVLMLALVVWVSDSILMALTRLIF